MNLKLWLSAQGLSVRELAVQMEVPAKTVEDWVYRGVVPKAQNIESLNNFISATCAHHWVIEPPNGPTSEGVCQRCGERRAFTNSAEPASASMWLTSHRPKAQ